MEIINPQLKELERKQEELQTTVAYMRGEIDELKHITRDTTRQTIWQFIIFTVTMSAVMLGGLKYQADVLRKEMDLHFKGVDQQFSSVDQKFGLVDQKFGLVDQKFGSMEKRMDAMEKNLLLRFDDLKQEVRQSRK